MGASRVALPPGAVDAAPAEPVPGDDDGDDDDDGDRGPPRAKAGSAGARRRRAATEQKSPAAADAPKEAAKAPPRRAGRLGTTLALVSVGALLVFAIANRSVAPPEPEPPQPSPAAAPSGDLAAAPPPTAPEPPASAAPEPPASAAAPPDDAPAAAPDEAGREALRNTVKSKQWTEAVDALESLAARDPAAFGVRPVAVAAREVAVAVAQLGGARANRVFDALSSRAGAAGIDILYEIIEARGRSAPAVRASELLRKPEVIARATPAARIAFQLRDAPCDKKLDLLDTAVADGDDRAILVLETHVKACFTQSRPVYDATRKLKERLKRR